MYRPKYYSTYILPSPFWHKKGTDFLCNVLLNPHIEFKLYENLEFHIQLCFKSTLKKVVSWSRTDLTMQFSWCSISPLFSSLSGFSLFFRQDIYARHFSIYLPSLLREIEDILNSIIHQIAHHYMRRSLIF